MRSFVALSEYVCWALGLAELGGFGGTSPRTSRPGGLEPARDAREQLGLWMRRARRTRAAGSMTRGATLLSRPSSPTSRSTRSFAAETVHGRDRRPHRHRRT